MPRPSFASHLSLKRLYHSSSNNNLTSDSDGHENSLNTTPASTDGSTSPTKMKENGEKPTILSLQIQVLKAKNLAPKDKSGTSDPYLTITLGDAREASSVVPKTLSPEWNQTFNLPVTGVESLLLEVVCWDKDRFGKDYMGEFDLALEEIFKNGQVAQEAQWYKLESKKHGKKKAVVSGDVLLRFSMVDPANPNATPQQIVQKFYSVVAQEPLQEDADLDDLARIDTVETMDPDDDDEESGETGQTTPSDDSRDPIEQSEKRKRRTRLAKLKRKTKLRAYEFSGVSDTAGVLFIEVSKVIDLPPERNMTRTSFDMDPFVITSLGKKTYRTRVIRHNLNPVFEEKLVFQVLRHEVNYSLHFTVMDRDKLSGNDFIGNVDIPLDKIMAAQPEADPATGLYNCQDPPDPSAMPSAEAKKSRFRLPLSRSSSYTSLGRSRNSSSQNLPKLVRTDSSNSTQGAKRPTLKTEESGQSFESYDGENGGPTSMPQGRSGSNGQSNGSAPAIQVQGDPADDPDFREYSLPIKMKKQERWEAKHSPTLYIKAKYLPYQALRQQFWRAMLRQYDADDSGKIDKVELTTMLDTLGSTLRDTTINSFFQRFAKDNGGEEVLTMDQAVMCLEDQLQKYQEHRSFRDTIKGSLPASMTTNGGETPGSVTPSAPSSSIGTPLNNQSQTSIIPAIETLHIGKDGEEGLTLPVNDLVDEERGEEHVVEIHECPICHQPRLDKKKNSEADIITHIATCASQDWRAVNNIVMGGFVTSSQAQRKWYSKVITKIGYGGYKIGANSANILVQDRITGQINEERMSVYVRLGIRLLYKGLGSKDMEKKRIRKLLKSMSFKQGRKYDDPASAAQITSFINFHQLDMSEVLLQTSEFKTFNEFFYRQLKPDARPCSAPDRPEIITSPADCRTVVFNRLEDAQRVWVKGREFSVERLLGKAYPQDAKRYQNGALGIFRLAPQDYHRFHIPVDGVMGEPKTIEGEYYTVNPMAIRSALDVYGENIRVLVPIDSEKHGRVMVICVGAMMVGSTVITRKGGDKVKRAEELGYFKFGGSTILLLFEPGVMEYDSDLLDNSNGALETLVRVGMSIGHSPNHAPHLPDMRKDNPTMEERQDAKRRIEGSFAPTRAIPGENEKMSTM
ncbi:Phosphatidylserine decarboxylase proenzyme 3 [Sphaceloma murrayae]|uniref:Phosphatidylserine decarboxylase proenzyme 2 n=1 Tax=Sphaceloma murrayae TaxID=2082308 RepID=A0A2K1QNC0_9PEZI|nr:Phosphatidylserine decarboxylase proenzyme 3 [Sphaceloma murrayae]